MCNLRIGRLSAKLTHVGTVSGQCCHIDAMRSIPQRLEPAGSVLKSQQMTFHVLTTFRMSRSALQQTTNVIASF